MNAREEEVGLLRLRSDVAWSADADRIYICRSPELAEFGLPTHGLPQPLLRLLFSQLRVGTTRRDLAFLYGAAFYRKIRTILKQLQERSLTETSLLRFCIRSGDDEIWYEPELARAPAEIEVPSRCRLLVQAGTASQFSLPVSLFKKARPSRAVYDITVAGGQLVLAHTREASLCVSCLLLWFFGSRVLPLSFLSACLNEHVSPTSSLRANRLERALASVRSGESAILYFPHRAGEGVIVDKPLGPHPACGCRRSARSAEPRARIRRPALRSPSGTISRSTPSFARSAGPVLP